MSVQRRLGRYAVLRRIGAGSFATVWLAYDDQLDSEVAVKVLAENWSADLHVRDRFVEEGRFLRRVDSPHVVPAYDAGELEDGRPFLVMAYADQGNLSERMGDQRLPGPQALTVIRHIGRGLTSLHDRGVLHRDVKPGNVLFRTVEDAQIRAMLGDLGLGKSLDGSSRLTMVAGTPAYVSPEQARGESVDARSDLYSLAALSYLLLSGRPAFDHTSLGAAGVPRPPAPLGDEWPDEVAQVVLRGLEADRDRRTGSIREFLAELDHACRGLDGEPTAEQLSSLPMDRGGEATVADTGRSTRPVRWLAPTEPAGPAIGADGAELLPGRRRRAGWLTVLASALALLAALVGFTLERRVPSTTTVSSDDFSITVPRGWDRVRGTEDWTPPGPVQAKPALVVGSARDWQTDTDESGAFIGVLPAVVTNDLVGPAPTFPEQLPGHPECSGPGSPDDTEIDGLRALTVISEGCPGVVAERALRTHDGVVLWIQVRGQERDQVEDVLASVSAR